MKIVVACASLIAHIHSAVNDNNNNSSENKMKTPTEIHNEMIDIYRKSSEAVQTLLSVPITTKHTQVGYTCNVDIVEQALRTQLGFDDNSFCIRAVAACIWSSICTQCRDDKNWTRQDVIAAIETCRARLDAMVPKAYFNMHYVNTGGRAQYPCAD